MTRSYMKFKKNPLTMPTAPEEQAKLWMTLLGNVKKDLASGALTDWGDCVDIGEGYCISELDEQELHTLVLKYVPFIIFDIKPVLNVDQVMESIQRVGRAQSL
jgi:hypothetical protein